MILGFSTKFPKGKGQLSGKNTFFVEKIIACLHCTLSVGIELNDYLLEGSNKLNHLTKDDYINRILCYCKKQKKHTIRKDESNRWKTGNTIDFFIGVRTKSMFRFAPKFLVKSIQKINITYNKEVCEAFGSEPCVFIDNKPLLIHDYKTLAINDGFETTEHFFEWFNEDFEGKIIHWTDLKY